MTEDRNEANRKVAEEFRANGGKVGGFFEDKDLLILHHVGARSGTRYESPLTWFRAGPAGGWAVAGVNGGRPNHPAWVHNLQAEPEVVVEVPDGVGNVATIPCRARFAEGEEREVLIETVRAHGDVLRGMVDRVTGREVPVVVLEPVDNV